MRVAVAGGTGLVGRLVVPQLRAAGHEPVVLSRSAGVDLERGTGLGALDGCPVVVDVTSTPTTSGRRSRAFFGAVTRTLLQARVEHLVVLSIVGIDQAPTGYYAGKVLQEELVSAGSVPSTVLRATQFHEFAGQLLSRLPPGPVVPVPRMLSQPVAAADVAAELVRLAGGPPLGRSVPPVAGPERLEMVDMVRRLLRVRGSRRLVVPLPLPGAAGRALRSGALCPSGPFTAGRQTYEEHLTSS